MGNKKNLPSKVVITFREKQDKTNGSDPHAMLSYHIEFLFRLVFGDDNYYGTAGSFNNLTYLKKNLKKLIKRLRSDIDNLQASEQFINRANHELAELESTIFNGDLTKERQQLVLVTLNLVVTFLGYGAGSKHKSIEPYFIPSVWQEMIGWTDSETYFANSTKLNIDYRMQIAKQLSDQGLTHAEIAEVLNQSGYRIAQLLNRAKTLEESRK